MKPKERKSTHSILMARMAWVGDKKNVVNLKNPGVLIRKIGSDLFLPSWTG